MKKDRRDQNDWKTELGWVGKLPKAGGCMGEAAMVLMMPGNVVAKFALEAEGAEWLLEVKQGLECLQWLRNAAAVGLTIMAVSSVDNPGWAGEIGLAAMTLIDGHLAADTWKLYGVFAEARRKLKR